MNESEYVQALMESVERFEETGVEPRRRCSHPSVRASVEAYAQNPERLEGDTLPSTFILKEKPEHRIVIYLKAQGLSNKEIARRIGYQESWVAQILRQPWARARLVKEIGEQGRDAIASLLQGTVEDSLFTLIDIRDSKDAKAADRVAAANSLLDRFLGKPTQRVETKTEELGRVEDVAKLESEITLLEKEIERHVGKN